MSFRIPPAAIGIGVGVLVVGAIGAAIWYDQTKGPSVEGEANGYRNRYNRDFNQTLSLRDDIWRGAEYLRTDTYRSGDWIYTDTNSIHGLLTKADGAGGGARDREVTRDELIAVLTPYDTNGDGHLKASERRDAARDGLAEVLVNRDRYYSPEPRSGSGTSPGDDGPGNGGSTSPGDDGPGSGGGSTSPGDDPATSPGDD